MLKLSDYLPDSLLIQRNVLHSKITEHEQHLKAETRFEKSLAFFLSTLLSLFSLILSGPEIWASVSGQLSKGITTLSFGSVIMLLLQVLSLLGITITFLISLVLTIAYKRQRIPQNDLFNTIVEETKEKMKYTGIILIADCSSPRTRFLLGNFQDQDLKYFFPYIRMNSSKSVNEQKELVVNHIMQTFEVSRPDILEVTIYNEKPHFSIKKTANRDGIDEHAFVYYGVKLNHNVKHDLYAKYRDAWMTLPELVQNPVAMAYNKDVINYVEELMCSISDSFITKSKPIKIIWNLTKKCNYNCSFCATRDAARRELEHREKTKILLNIATLKDRIVKLDISGGDPCLDDDNLTVIKNAISQFGSSTVSVTTTGLGIEKACMSEATSMVVNNCEITIDALGDSSKIVRNKNEHYYDENIEKVINNITHIRNLVINIPIISNELNDTALSLLIQNIKEIKSHSVALRANLIRLMPVGGMTNLDYPNDYNPSKAIEQIMTNLSKNGIAATVHCSLKVSKIMNGNPRTSKQHQCNMIERKIGIDCAGNVFACGWAGYLPDHQTKGSLLSPMNNPFYLGTLSNSSLDDILSDQNKYYKELRERISKSLHNRITYCPVASYAINEQWFKNHDPLY